METTTIADGEIVQTGEVGAAPSLNPLVPAFAPPLPYRLAARVDVDYVAGGVGNTTAYARSLPAYIDDLSERVGPDVYKQMMRDSQVAGDLRYLRLSALSNGVTLLPALKEGDAYYKRAVTLRDWCQENLDAMESDLGSVLFDLLECTATGYRAAIIVLRQEDGQYRLHKIQPKPNDTLAFVVDNLGNTIGLQVMLAGQGRGLTNQTAVDPSSIPNLLPRSKFALCTFLPTNNDPRGQSLLYAAYDAWYQKQQTLIDLARFLKRFGSPSIIGITAPDELASVKKDAEGNIVYDAYGMPSLLSPEQQLLDALVEFQNASALALKHGGEATIIEAQSTGEAFRFAIEMHNQSISKGILSNTLTTNESQFQTRAATGKQKNVSDLIIEEVEKTAARMLRKDVLFTLIAANFGEAQARKFTPLVSLSSVEEADFGEMATAFAAVGYKLSPEQLPEADKKLGMTPRSDEAIADLKASMAPPVTDPANPGTKPEPTPKPKTE